MPLLRFHTPRERRIVIGAVVFGALLGTVAAFAKLASERAEQQTPER
jgi:type II secretory pathway component PulM